MVKLIKTPLFAFSLAVLVESIAALVWLMAIPGEGKQGLLFGISLERLLLASVPFFFTILSAITLSIGIMLPPGKFNRVMQFTKIGDRFHLAPILFWLGSTSLAIMLVGEVVLGFAAAVVERLTPVLFLVFLVMVQAAILVMHRSKPLKSSLHIINVGIFLLFTIIGIVLALIGFAVGLGQALGSPYASNTGIPILPYQIIIALYIAATYACIQILLKEHARLHIVLPGVVFVILFITASRQWLSIPIPENHFMHASNLGNGDFILHSDALTYDINAHKMLMGNGLAGGAPLPRPLYSFFLGVVHFLVGTSVSAAVDAQTVVLAFIPALIFLLSWRFLSPSAGVLAATLFIFREANQAMLSEIYTLSSARMLMTELFTALFLVILAIVAMIWMQAPTSRTRAIITGALIGFTALIRTQVLVLFPLLALWGLGALWVNRRYWLRSLFWVSIGLLLVILPWIGRNTIRSGTFTFEDPSYSTRTLVVHDKQGETNGVMASAVANPLDYLAQTTSYFANNATSSLNQFPFSESTKDDLSVLIQQKPEPPFYPGQRTQLTQVVLLLLHIVLIIVGLAFAWQKGRWGGLVPLATYLGYALSSSLARYSGWRFILPVDWVFLLYWALGVVACIEMFARLFGTQVENYAYQQIPDHPREWPIGYLITGALLLGLLVPIGETLFPRKTVTLDKPSLQQTIIHSAPPESIQALANDPSTRLAQGILVYPIFLEGEHAINRLAISNPLIRSKIPLIRFVVLGEDGATVYLPMKNAPKAFSPGVKVIAVGCMRDTTFFAAGVLLEEEQPRWLLSDRDFPSRCNEKWP